VNPHVTILGAGLSGALMSIFLARNARKVQTAPGSAAVTSAVARNRSSV